MCAVTPSNYDLFDDDDFDAEEQRMFSCLDCGRRDFYQAVENQPKKCSYCGGCLLPMRRMSSRRRMIEVVDIPDEKPATRYCIFCKAALRDQNQYLVCTASRCWKQFVVLGLGVSAPLEIETILLREYRKLGEVAYIRASIITLGGRRWVVDGYFKPCLPPPGYIFEGKMRMCKKRVKRK